MSHVIVNFFLLGFQGFDSTVGENVHYNFPETVAMSLVVFLTYSLNPEGIFFIIIRKTILSH